MSGEQQAFMNQDIEKLLSGLNSGNTEIDPQKAGTILDTILSDESVITKSIKRNGIADFVNLGHRLLDLGENVTTKFDEDTRKLLFQFLELGRNQPILKQVYQQGQTEAWFDLLLKVIRTANFNTGQMFLQRANKYSDKVLFKVIQDGVATDFTWQEIQDKVFTMARALLSLDLQDDTCPVAILSENCLDMACLDLACLITGIVNVPIAANSIETQVEYILRQTQAKIVFVSNDAQLHKFLECQNKLKDIRHIVIFKSSQKPLDGDAETFENFLTRADDMPIENVHHAIERTQLDNLATIMYTSGTTEAPKGIMFSHLNIVSKRFARAIALPEIGDQDTFLCYLPLFHTFGRYFEMVGCVFWGSTYVFMESPKLETMIQNFKLAKPTVFISIPKKWSQLFEKIQESVDIDIDSRDRIKAKAEEITGGNLKWGLSAAGYLDPDIFRLFQNCGIELMSGFGMTEATGGITMTPPHQYRHNSVGTVLPGIEIQLADDGEMLIRGPYVTKGYFGEGKQDYEQEWLPTGDIFSKDEDGFYWIVDRKKDIYKNVKGETISPQKIENMFQDFEAVKQVFLVGDHRPYNTLLLYPNYEYEELEFSEMSQDQLRDFFKSHVVSVNRFLAPFERIVDFTVIDRPFEKEQGELTPKGTFRRKALEKNFGLVIESMYKKEYVTRTVDGLEIRIPNWFLKENGLTPGDISQERNRLIIRPSKAQLQIEKRDDKLKIGTCWYVSDRNYLNLNEFINEPTLWLGNVGLAEFIGEKRLLKRSFNAGKSGHIKMVEPEKPFDPEPSVLHDFIPILNDKQPTKQGIHYAAHLIQTSNEKVAKSALDYLALSLSDSEEDYASTAKAIMLSLSGWKNIALRRQAFQILLGHAQNGELEGIFQKFLHPSCDVLDKATISKICGLTLKNPQMDALFGVLNSYYCKGSEEFDQQTKTCAQSLVDLITSYGVAHPTKFKPIRFELTKWACFEADESIQRHAGECLDELLASFRDWLGPNQQIAVDPETTEEYRWNDVISFEEDVDEADKQKMFSAIQKEPVVREALFLFSTGSLVRLQDIAHKGVWVSLLGTRHGKSVYRVSVQTRHYGAFDFAINLNKELTEDDVASETTWLIRLGASKEQDPLVEDFGGHWPQFGLWTEEFIPGETIEKVLKRLNRHTGHEWTERMRHLWPNFAWSGISAYIDFWNRTGRKLEIADPMIANVIVPPNDYKVGHRIVSISNRDTLHNLLDMLLSLQRNSVTEVESRFKKLEGICGWTVILSAFLEVLGEKDGTNCLEKISQQLEQTSDKKITELRQKLNLFLKKVDREGFRPKRLHFAIRRYQRWYELNPSATPQARMQTIQELYNTYTLDNLESAYPGTRIQLFRDTVFQESDQKIIDSLNKMVQKMRTNHVSEDELLKLISEIRKQNEISDDDEFFLTRLTYPHLSPEDSAQLISLVSEGGQKTALVVFIEDSEGNPLSIRQPTSPKEIAKLHKLFTIAKLAVEFRPEHQYLVVLNERYHVIGGLFYHYTKRDQVHMDKIVLDERYRRKGISVGLLNEFFNRLRSQGVRIVTVGFLRPQFFYRLGFTIDRGFGNMVKRLEPMTEVGAEDDTAEQL